MSQPYFSASLRLTLLGVSLLLLFACATAGNDVSASYRPISGSTLTGVQGRFRRAPSFELASPGTLNETVQERLRHGYRVVGHSDFTSTAATPLRAEATTQAMQVGASVVIYSVQSQTSAPAQHKIVFLKVSAGSAAH